MNKITYVSAKVLAVCAILSLSLASCSDDGDNGGKGGESDKNSTTSVTENNTNDNNDGGSMDNSSEETPFIDNFLKDVKSLENFDSKDRISEFTVNAMKSADESMSFTNDISEVLRVAKDYKFLVITVSDHTIVRVDDPSNCKDSGSWGACMPYGKGYIKRGDLNFQEDYINNIIGRADDQERMAFFFN